VELKGVLQTKVTDMFSCNFTLRYAVFVRYYSRTNIVQLGHIMLY